jgi:hypothetical protein
VLQIVAYAVIGGTSGAATVVVRARSTKPPT